MMSLRSHDQFNTHIYGLDDRYRGVYKGRRVIFMNAEDVKEANLQQGRLVDLTGYFEGEKRSARHSMVTPYNIPRNYTATCYPETNVPVSINSTADRSNTPTSKFIVITVVPLPDADKAVNKIIHGARENTTHEPAALAAK